MASMLHRAVREKLITPPAWLANNLHLEVIMGSRAYGCNSPESDYDLGGFCIPPKEELFPHLKGGIPGWDKIPEPYDQYQKVHIKDSEARKEYGFAIYSIVKFFKLCAGSNPNMVDTLFVPTNCVTYSTQIGQRVRDCRHLFLSKLSWPTFKGYAFQQLHKMDSKEAEGNRLESILKYGYDVKYAYHIVRLVDECEQLLTTGDLDLQRASELMKTVRRGEWTREQVVAHFERQLPILEAAYAKTSLPERPDMEKLKALLLECLETHYGSLDKVVAKPNRLKQALKDIDAILTGVRSNVWASQE